MLSNREISEQFEVQVNTLYNWQKNKPKLYKYLQNADYNKTRNKEVNILLDEYSKSFNLNFTVEDIAYMIDSKFFLNNIKDVKNIQKIFIETEYKNIPSKRDRILSIYDKLIELNLIEKYILFKKIHKFRDFDEIKKLGIPQFFSEFIKNS